jgi:hypothetical protein
MPRAVTGLCTSVGRHGYTVDLVAGYDQVRDASLILPDVSIQRQQCGTATLENAVDIQCGT